MNKCPICGNEVPLAVGGRPKEYCSPKCRLKAHRRKDAGLTAAGEQAGVVAQVVGGTEESAVKRLEEMKAVKAVGKDRVEGRGVAEFKGEWDVYMPTVNDANISAMMRGEALPYPEGGARVLRDVMGGSSCSGS